MAAEVGESGRLLGAQLKQEGAAEHPRAEQLRWSRHVLRMRRLKFGTSDEAITQRVRAASIEVLEWWAEDILTAETCEALFAE